MDLLLRVSTHRKVPESGSAMLVHTRRSSRDRKNRSKLYRLFTTCLYNIPISWFACTSAGKCLVSADCAADSVGFEGRVDVMSIRKSTRGTMKAGMEAHTTGVYLRERSSLCSFSSYSRNRNGFHQWSPTYANPYSLLTVLLVQLR